MTAEEMKRKFSELYQIMATSENVEFMHIFGNVHKEMMDWMITNKPELAKEWIEKLCSIKWKNYVTEKEAAEIVANMEPEAPWSFDQWKSAMEKHGYRTETEPYYNPYALWVTMCMIMSDSSDTITKYVGEEDVLGMVYELAVDKLMDKDYRYKIRKYFS